ncbi:MAG: membrane dipeptidase, partial [Flavobacteriaceae bacterium]|nr:membrane dipeptidase [Flavobacteriaceae bacterium]
SLGYQWLEAGELAKLPVADQETYYETLMKTEPMRVSKMKRMTGLPPAVNVSDLVDHIDYLVKLIGIEHVGISSDFDGGGGIEGWRDASETFNVTYELVKRGYTEEQIGMLWSGNLLRVLDEVQQVANEIQNNNQ